jgi:predicted NBD/HSP70 family sugar kinase
VSELLDHADAYIGKTVRVEGLITDVCPKRGCWMEIAGDREFETVRIKVEDGVIVFPMDAKGKRAVAEGVFARIELTKEQALQHAKHMAEERGQAFDEAKAQSLPTVVYQIQGTGAVIQ